jgi:hypothetical protein
MKKIGLLIVLLVGSIILTGVSIGEDRENLPDEEALLGHWVCKKPVLEGVDQVDHYYSSSHFTVVAIVDERWMDYAESELGENIVQICWKYKVIAKSSNWLKIRYYTKPSGNTLRKKITFSPDKKSFTTDKGQTYEYVDSKQKP